MDKPVIETRDLKKVYFPGKENEVNALRGVDLKIYKKDFIAILGPSGSGKSTLLHMLGCLDRPTSGKVFIDGKDSSKLSDEELAKIRGKRIGFVFQQFNLISVLTAQENIELSMRLIGVKEEVAKRRAMELLKLVGLENRAGHLPSQLSGGEQQRVTIARALANEPEIILADEPTGDLDTRTGAELVRLMKVLSKKGYTFVIVTHDFSIASFANRRLNMIDGKIIGKGK